jgi:cytochrome c oxidase assembly protein subunit 11
MTATTLQQRNRKVGVIALAIACGMLGLGYAAVPLYQLFCQVTGFGGTTQRASEAEAAAVPVSSRTMSIRFDARAGHRYGLYRRARHGDLYRPQHL